MYNLCGSLWLVWDCLQLLHSAILRSVSSCDHAARGKPLESFLHVSAWWDEMLQVT